FDEPERRKFPYGHKRDYLVVAICFRNETVMRIGQQFLLSGVASSFTCWERGFHQRENMFKLFVVHGQILPYLAVIIFILYSLLSKLPFHTSFRYRREHE